MKSVSPHFLVTGLSPLEFFYHTEILQTFGSLFLDINKTGVITIVPLVSLCSTCQREKV
jgi:hypothetical protein